MAPEIHLEAPYQGKQVDLFAAAMILFIMVAQHPPFTRPRPMTHSINALQAIGLTYSGELIARTSQEVKAISQRNSRSYLLVCFRLSLLTDLQCLKSWPILGCKRKLQLSRISNQDLNKGMTR